MGLPMADRLLDAGFALAVHNRSYGLEAGLRDADARHAFQMRISAEPQFLEIALAAERYPETVHFALFGSQDA